MLSPDGSGRAHISASAVNHVRASGALDKPRCWVCGKREPTAEHLQECAEQAALMDATSRRSRSNGARSRRK